VNRELPNQIAAKAGNRDIADLNQHQAHLSLAGSLSCWGIWNAFLLALNKSPQITYRQFAITNSHTPFSMGIQIIYRYLGGRISHPRTIKLLIYRATIPMLS
jgi:hypothetical protein